MIKKTLNKLAIYLGIFMMFGITLFPNLRGLIGNVVGMMLNPLLELLPLYMIIFVLAYAFGVTTDIILLAQASRAHFSQTHKFMLNAFNFCPYSIHFHTAYPLFTRFYLMLLIVYLNLIHLPISL